MEEYFFPDMNRVKRLECNYKLRVLEQKDFFENNLGLSKNNKIPGRVVVGHNESLFFWEELLEQGKLTDPFEVVHVDSHADFILDVFREYIIEV